MSTVVNKKAVVKKSAAKKTKEVIKQVATITKDNQVTFKSMGLPEALMHTLTNMGIEKPTPVQEKAIPLAIEGKDILGSAQTGTGKTAAFGVPLVKHLMENPEGLALVMTPTRELAAQVMKQLQDMLGRHSSIRNALLIGGAPMFKQLQQLKRSPRLIVGTPGRIYDHLDRGSLNLENTSYLVLDETDRMLDMGFTIQIDSIMEYMSARRQTLLFSATLPKNIIRIADKYLTKPVRVEIGSTTAPAENITRDVKHLKQSEKYPILLSELEAREGSIIIFVKTKRATEELAKRLYQKGHAAEAIHGDLRQHKRDRVIAGFRKHKYRILVATDVAARGLDIPHIEHVINYDLPQCAEDYIHRIGRTARAGAKGNSLCFVSPECRRKWDAIDRLLNPDKPRSRSSGNGQRGKRSYGRNDSGFGRKREGGFGKKREGFGNREGGRNRDRSNREERREDGFGKKREGFGGRDERRNRDGDRRREGGFGKKRDSRRDDFFGKKKVVKRVKRKQAS